MKKWYESKVVWIAIIQAIIAIVAIFITAIPDWASALLITKSILDIILRTVTTTQIGSEQE